LQLARLQDAAVAPVLPLWNVGDRYFSLPAQRGCARSVRQASCSRCEHPRPSGTPILPGRFNPWGAIVAVYFLGTGITGLSMVGTPLWVTNVFHGGALILAVTISQLTRGREASDIGSPIMEV
jgi:hypothetical protein